MSHRSQGIAAFVKSVLIVGVALGGLSGSGRVEAKRAPPSANVPERQPVDARGNGKNEGQRNDRCETDQDCSQRAPTLTCQPVGDQKVCRIKPGTIMPPT
jgi:hypothetical protein